jgi:AraC-like DNA-binding protein
MADGTTFEPETDDSATVRVDGLRQYRELVARLGGNADRLLAKVHVDPAMLRDRHAVIPYRALVLLLERSAFELKCPDFGMRLAVAQGGLKVLGPLEFAMRNARTLREAFQYCARHPQVYSTASRMRLDSGYAEDALLLKFEILLPRAPPHLQAVERALLLTQLIAREVTHGGAAAREIWFRHTPLIPPVLYREYFGAAVRFGQPLNGMLFTNAALDVPIPNIDNQLYELTTDFIEQRFPSIDAPLSQRVRTIVERLLLDGSCAYGKVAARLEMHPRMLQRRLRAAGESFESIKDGVRRDIALRYLTQSTLPLIRVAQLLGYSDTSALSRSCDRWFSVPPRQLREGNVVAWDQDQRVRQS